jgi:3-methylfumaryl-CoA hydratase
MSIDDWKRWIGKTETRTEVLDPGSLSRFAAAIGEDIDVERTQPSLAHWAFFLPVTATEGIGEDGHPKRGGFLPPVTLPRRMFAAADMTFSGALTLGARATRTSAITDVALKSGKSGDLVLVLVEHRITQDGAEKVVERQTIVYRDAGAPTPPVIASDPAQQGDVTWTPNTVDLFRFSAATSNSHRIHYDLPYATAEEGYPGLVVHGPFTAARLFGHARRKGALSAFSFRAMAPMFCGQPIMLRHATDGVEAARCDGAIAMQAKYSL